VPEIHGKVVVDALTTFKEILQSLEAASEQASKGLYILYSHPNADEALYRQVKEQKGLAGLGVGGSLLPKKS
jgi:hypothetical protein